MIVTAQHKLEWDAATAELNTKFSKAAKYVVDDSLVAILQRQDITASIKSLLDEDIMMLPYSPMLVEFSLMTTGRWFILLEDSKDREGFLAQVVYLHKKTEKTIYSSKDVQLYAHADGFIAANCRDKVDGQAAIAAAAMALLFLNTQGIDKVHVEGPPKLNKQRLNNRKQPIPDVTILKIGTVYDRNGDEVPASEVARGKMPFHIRRGHARHQHFGKNRSERKWIKIPPTLVNYDPSKDIQKPPKPVKASL